ncbi:hypothetical protein ACSTK1_23535, partial [Vibrio parahaemolyticus]
GAGHVMPEFRALSLDKVRLAYRNGMTKQVREANVIQFDMTRESADRIAAKLNAEINGVPVELAGTLGRFDDLLNAAPWPIDVKG